MMTVNQVLQPFVGSGKGLIMSWQDKHVFRQPLFQLFTAFEPVEQWIRRRLSRVDGYVGRDPRQNLVT